MTDGGQQFKTAELRDGESPDRTAHDLANARAKQALQELKEEETDDE